MAMKIVLAVAIVVALGYVTDQSCTDRSDDMRIRSMIKKARCRDPHLSLVPLPVPDGYEFVQPSVVKLFQCTNLHCNVLPDRCFPVPGNTTPHTFRVNAMTRNGIESDCVEVSVEEHYACQCSCHVLTCPINKVYSERSCQCECDPSQMMTCLMRRNTGQPVMWSEDRCSCVCDNETQCDSSMSFWDPDVCRCVDK